MSQIQNWTPQQMELKTKFNFGKYKGRTLAEVISQDQGYVDWCLKNNVIIVSPLRGYTKYEVSKEVIDNRYEEVKIRKKKEYA